MKRTKLKDRVLPSYTTGEEIFNMVSHITGGAVGIVAIVLCSIFAGIKGNVYGVVSGVIFGASMVVLYTSSSIYHGLRNKGTAKKVFQIIDHCNIFLLIAGTYTPVALCTLREHNTAEGWIIFGVIWAMATVGIVLNSIDLKRYSIFSMICYLVMGWCIVFRINVLIEVFNKTALALLILGGVCYTVGAGFYGFKKIKWFHSVFHIFCVAGSILHMLFIILYVI